MTIYKRCDIIWRILDINEAVFAADYAFVAQGIEQRFPVPCVGGSIPSRRVKNLKYLSRIYSGFFSIEI